MKHHVAGHTSVWQNYLISIYWSAATMTTVGYGEISAYNTQVHAASTDPLHKMFLDALLGDGCVHASAVGGCNAVWLLPGCNCCHSHQRCGATVSEVTTSHLLAISLMLNFCLHCLRVSFQEKVEAIHQFMDDHKMGRSLVRRMDRYLTLLWKQYK